MSAVIFQGSAVKALKNELKFFTAGSIQSGTADPSSVATAGDPGSLYINTSSGVVYRKTDSGTTTNWSNITSTSPNLSVTSKTANYTISVNDDLVLADSSGGTFTLTFPTPAGNTGKKIIVKKTDSTFTEVSLSGTGITGDLMTQGETREYVSDGSNWQLTKWDNETDFIGYTPTFSASIGTITSEDFWYRREGDFIHVRGLLDSTGGSAAEAQIGLPTGLTIDATKNASLFYVGNIQLDSANNTSNNIGSSYSVVAEPSNSYVGISWRGTASGGLVKADGVALNGQVASFDFMVPITGWNK